MCIWTSCFRFFFAFPDRKKLVDVPTLPHVTEAFPRTGCRQYIIQIHFLFIVILEQSMIFKSGNRFYLSNYHSRANTDRVILVFEIRTISWWSPIYYPDIWTLSSESDSLKESILNMRVKIVTYLWLKIMDYRSWFNLWERQFIQIRTSGARKILEYCNVLPWAWE